MTRFAILLGGDLVPTPRLTRQIAGARGIAADSGIRHAAALGLAPELWVGDFDSVTPEMRTAHAAIETSVYPPDKDMTDGELAIDAALARGATELVLVGAFGGQRADHAFLHLSAALRLAERGVATILSSGDQEGRPLLPGRTAFDYPEDTLFSILAFTELTGLSVSGAKWPLSGVIIPFGSSLTLSNATRGPLAIDLGGGRAMLVVHLDPSAGA